MFATATTAACGGYREELLGQRPARCECRPRHEADAGCRNPSDPARRNRCDLAALNTRHLLRKPVRGLKAPLGLSCPPGTAVLSGSLLVPKENNPRPAAARRNRCALAALNTRHLLRKPVCGLKAPLGLSCPPAPPSFLVLFCASKENTLVSETLSQETARFACGADKSVPFSYY